MTDLLARSAAGLDETDDVVQADEEDSSPLHAGT